MDCHEKEAAAGQRDTIALMISCGALCQRPTSRQSKSRQVYWEPMVNDQTASYSYHGRMEDVSHGTSRWRIWWHNPSYLSVTSQTSGAATRSGGGQADSQVGPMPHWHRHLFMAIAAETMGAINSDAIEFLDDLGRRITQVTDDNREKAFLYQRLSVIIQRYNAVATQALRTSFSRSSWSGFNFCFNPWDLYYRGR